MTLDDFNIGDIVRAIKQIAKWFKGVISLKDRNGRELKVGDIVYDCYGDDCGNAYIYRHTKKPICNIIDIAHSDSLRLQPINPACLQYIEDKFGSKAYNNTWTYSRCDFHTEYIKGGDEFGRTS